MPTLFDPLKIGKLTLPNRILLAPLTRCRADAETHVPTPIMAEYYAQRASGGLLIAEATMAMPFTSAFYAEPGIYSPEQIEGWRQITNAVHKEGGHIFLQIWHPGRATHPLVTRGGEVVAPSPIAISGDQIHTPEGKKDYPVPRELRDEEIPAIIAGFRKAAANAIEAGFDGVEIHGANGYLIDEFIRDGTNKRTGPYGGSVENRARLVLEITSAVIEEIGSDRVGVRISPLNSYNDMRDSNPVETYVYLATQLNALGIAYLHLMEHDLLGIQKGDVLTPIRKVFQRPIIGNMGHTHESAEEAVAAGRLDAVAFGRSFLANPDLPSRFKAGAPLNEPDAATFYSSGAKGYTDYPALAEQTAGV